MVFLAQIDQAAKKLVQGLAFSTAEHAQPHMAAHPEFTYISVDEFVSPQTHQYVNGQVARKE